MPANRASKSAAFAVVGLLCGVLPWPTLRYTFPTGCAFHSTLLGGTATITHNCQTGSVNSGTCAFREDDRLRRKVQSKLLGNATDDRGRCAVHQRVLQWFLASSDEIAVLFVNTDFNTQKNMLLMSLVHVASFDPIHGSDAIMKRFAIRHRDLHVLSHLYRLWLESLLDTVKAYDPEYD